MLQVFILRIHVIKINNEFLWNSHTKFWLVENPSGRNYFGIKKWFFGGNRNSDFYYATVTDREWIFNQINIMALSFWSAPDSYFVEFTSIVLLPCDLNILCRRNHPLFVLGVVSSMLDRIQQSKAGCTCMTKTVECQQFYGFYSLWCFILISCDLCLSP